MATLTQTGPRRLVLRDIAQQSAPPSVGSGLLGAVNPPAAGSLSTSSWSDPGLIHGASYTATVAQTVTYTDTKAKIPTTQPTQPAPNDLTRSQSFHIVGSRYTLDRSLIHSVYPPQGHADFQNTLPHLLYSNDQVPWMFNTDRPPKPWCALLLLTGDELTLDATDLSNVTEFVNAPPSGTTGAITQDSVSLATILTKGQLGTLLATQIKDDPYLQPESFQTDQAVRAVVFPDSVYKSLISTADRYSNLTHVRTIDASSLVNFSASESGTFAVSVCPRICPGSISAPTKVYAHLVALPAGGTPLVPLKISDTRSLCALPSLFSWSWMALPAPLYNIDNDLHSLGMTVQPLRNSDAYINQANQTKAEAWIRRRMMAGYNIGGCVPATGEATTCIYRTMMSPIDQPRSALPSSDNGLDLAILDVEQAVYDVTFPLAWELGRMTAIADKALSSAIMRLRGAAHKVSLNTGKVSVDQDTTKVYRSAIALCQGLQDSGANLQAMTILANAAPVTSQRWLQRPTVLISTRATLAFPNTAIQSAYQIQMPTTAKSLTSAVIDPGLGNPMSGNSVDRPTYNGSNTPESTDYAAVLNWYFDRMYLYGLPWVNLIGDPAYVPRESIRTFYVDTAWCDVFLDGVLTVGEHFTGQDEARQQIKACVKHCLTVPNVNGHLPQIPVWGFFLRSEICQKFPDLQVTAPRASDQEGLHGADILRCDLIDDDLLLVLFDRKPGFNAFPQGITIQPPEHQLKFSLGNIDDWTFGDSGVVITPNLALNPVNVPGTNSPIFPDVSAITGPTLPIDLASGFITPEVLANTIQKVFSKVPHVVDTAYDGLAALIGSQLVAKNPMLTLNDNNSLGSLQAMMVQPAPVVPPSTRVQPKPIAKKATSKATESSSAVKAPIKAKALAGDTSTRQDQLVSDASALAAAQKTLDTTQQEVNVQIAHISSLKAQIAAFARDPAKLRSVLQLNQQLTAASASLATVQTALISRQATVASHTQNLPGSALVSSALLAPASWAPTWETTQQTILFNAFKNWTWAQSTGSSIALQQMTIARNNVLQTNLLYFLEMLSNTECNEPAFVAKYLTEQAAKYDNVMDWTTVSFAPKSLVSIYLVQLYNLKTTLPLPGHPQQLISSQFPDPEHRHLYAVLPLSLGLKSDVTVSVTPYPYYPLASVSGIDMAIPVGPAAVLAPFPHIDATTAFINTKAGTPSAGSRNDFPHLGRATPGTVSIPKVRMQGDSVHWVPRVTYTPASTDPNEMSGTLNVSISLAGGICPPKQTGVIASAFPDLSFVIQDVVVNYNKSTPVNNAQLTVTWNENIYSWQGPTDDQKGWSGSTRNTVLTPVFAVDTQSGMAIMPPMRTYPAH